MAGEPEETARLDAGCQLVGGCMYLHVGFARQAAFGGYLVHDSFRQRIACLNRSMQPTIGALVSVLGQLLAHPATLAGVVIECTSTSYTPLGEYASVTQGSGWSMYRVSNTSNWWQRVTAGRGVPLSPHLTSESPSLSATRSCKAGQVFTGWRRGGSLGLA